jgi:hypothetical protein
VLGFVRHGGVSGSIPTEQRAELASGIKRDERFNAPKDIADGSRLRLFS